MDIASLFEFLANCCSLGILLHERNVWQPARQTATCSVEAGEYVKRKQLKPASRKRGRPAQENETRAKKPRSLKIASFCVMEARSVIATIGLTIAVFDPWVTDLQRGCKDDANMPRPVNLCVDH